MKNLVLATKNKHKIKEFQAMLKGYKILSLEDIGFDGEFDETGETTGENAKIKTTAVIEFCRSKNLDYAVISDDSGLFVNALGGAPGVHSARFAGNHDDEANRQKLLAELQEKLDRSAYFECSICYADWQTLKIFVGRTYGKITEKKIGSDKFGYDCLFYSNELNKTFGEASESEKDAVSHRGRAVEKFKNWIEKNNPNFDRTLKFNQK